MADILIAGGGLAGASCAALLARAGRRVTVIERSTGPHHKICGEFVSAEARHYLAAAGLDLAALGGHEISRFRLVRGALVAETALPFAGLGLSRYRLDEALLAHAAAQGAQVERGRTASAADGVLFHATGKHDLRGARRQAARPPPDLVGFKTYFDLIPAQRAALSGAVEIMLFPDGYAGLQLVEEGRANLCLLVDRARLARVGGQWADLLADLRADSPHLAARLAGARPLLDPPLAISRVPYGFIHRPVAGETQYRLGDQACVIPSFSGDGMSIALHSASLAASCHLQGLSPEAYHRRLARDVARPMQVAAALYRAGRWGLGQTTLVAAGRLWPGLLRQAARATRVPRNAWT